jgi:hypothetical protein
VAATRTVVRAPLDAPGVSYAYVSDPDGYIIEI